MGDLVWISHAPSDPTLADGLLKSDLQDERLIELSKIARNGGTLDQADFPAEVFGEVGEYRAHHFRNEWALTSLTSVASGLSPASSPLILQKFNLGGGAIGSVRLRAKDRVTPVAGEWFCWNVGTVKEAFLPDQSLHIRPAPGRKWRTLGAVDHDLKCSPAAMIGADAWIDPMLRGALFFSAELGRALVEADLATERAGLGTLLKVDVLDA